MAIGLGLSSADISAPAHSIDVEAAQLRHAGKQDSPRFKQIEQELLGLQKQCPHETGTHKNVCVDCGATVTP